MAVPAVVLLGLSKGGFSGAGALSLPALAFVISPVRAAAILLPILIVQDVISIWAFRRDWDARIIGWMLPGAALGILLGWFFAASVSPRGILAAVGATSALFGLYRLWVERNGVPAAKSGAGWVGVVAGIASGFTSQIAHAGQPPFQLWVVPQRLPRDMLIGTTAVFFGIVNWAKVPAYWGLGQFTAENLTTSAALLPVAILSTIAGVALVRRVDPARFYTLIYVLMVLVGLRLIWDGVS